MSRGRLSYTTSWDIIRWGMVSKLTEPTIEGYPWALPWIDCNALYEANASYAGGANCEKQTLRY
jgi:hypothetical protein